MKSLILLLLTINLLFSMQKSPSTEYVIEHPDGSTSTLNELKHIIDKVEENFNDSNATTYEEGQDTSYSSYKQMALYIAASSIGGGIGYLYQTYLNYPDSHDPTSFFLSKIVWGMLAGPLLMFLSKLKNPIPGLLENTLIIEPIHNLQTKCNQLTQKVTRFTSIATELQIEINRIKNGVTKLETSIEFLNENLESLTIKNALLEAKQHEALENIEKDLTNIKLILPGLTKTNKKTLKNLKNTGPIIQKIRAEVTKTKQITQEINKEAKKERRKAKKSEQEEAAEFSTKSPSSPPAEMFNIIPVTAYPVYSEAPPPYDFYDQSPTKNNA